MRRLIPRSRLAQLSLTWSLGVSLLTVRASLQPHYTFNCLHMSWFCKTSNHWFRFYCKQCWLHGNSVCSARAAHKWSESCLSLVFYYKVHFAASQGGMGGGWLAVQPRMSASLTLLLFPSISPSFWFLMNPSRRTISTSLHIFSMGGSSGRQTSNTGIITTLCPRKSFLGANTTAVRRLVILRREKKKQ